MTYLMHIFEKITKLLAIRPALKPTIESIFFLIAPLSIAHPSTLKSVKTNFLTFVYLLLVFFKTSLFFFGVLDSQPDWLYQLKGSLVYSFRFGLFRSTTVLFRSRTG